VKFLRCGLHKLQPGESIDRIDLEVKEGGMKMIVPWTNGRLTHPQGYMFNFVKNREYNIGVDHPQAIRGFTFAVFNMDDIEDYFMFNTSMASEKRDRVEYTTGGVFVPGNNDSVGIPATTALHGSNYFDSSDSTTYFHGSGQGPRVRDDTQIFDNIVMTAYKCPPGGCPVPPPVVIIPENATRLWSNTDFSDVTAGCNITIPKGWTVLLDTSPEKICRLTIEGTLIVENLEQSNITLKVDMIWIRGGKLLAGNDSVPYLGHFEIQFFGDRSSKKFELNDVMELGSKFLGVTGTLYLRGRTPDVVWTHLAATANVGDINITTMKAVDWKVGDEIVIATSDYEPHHTETRTITGISGDAVMLDAPLKYLHFGITSTYGSSTVEHRAEVGLLSRNVRIVGAGDFAIDTQEFGVHTIVSNYQDQQTGEVYIASAKVTAVEFKHYGQLGMEGHYGLAFLNLYNGGANSMVSACAFNKGFSRAVSMQSTNKITIEDNVAYHSIGKMFSTKQGRENVFRRNFGTLMIDPKTYPAMGQFEMQHVNEHTAIFSIFGEDHVFQDNAAGGAERLGVEAAGDNCESYGRYTGNVVHSALVGWKFTNFDVNCRRLDNLYVYKTWDFGIFGYVKANLFLENITLSDNKIGINTMIVMPMNKVSYKKFVIISESDAAGQGCAEPRPKRPDPMSIAQTDPFVGIMASGFTEGFGKQSHPPYPWERVKSWPSGDGFVTVDDIQFVNFKGDDSCGRQQRGFMNNWKENAKNHDTCNPVGFSNVKWVGGDENGRFFFHEPLESDIQIVPCGNMYCDATKHCLLIDVDGSLIGGQPGGSVITSHQAWPSWGRTNAVWWQVDNPSNVMGNKEGIYRGKDGDCSLQPAWNAYKCTTALKHATLVLESLDKDSQTRRVAPIGITVDGYTDILNGPAIYDNNRFDGTEFLLDRLSRFSAIVPTGKAIRVDYTGTIPRNNRFKLNDVDPSEGVVLSLYYPQNQVLIVNVDGKEVKGIERMPEPTDPHGTNYYVHKTKEMHVAVRGQQEVQIRMTWSVYIALRLKADINTFFADDFVNNLCYALNIDTSRVKIVSVKPGSVIVDFHILPEIKNVTATANATQSSNATANSTESSQGQAQGQEQEQESLTDITQDTYSELANVGASLATMLQSDTLGSSLGIPVLGAIMEIPAPPPVVNGSNLTTTQVQPTSFTFGNPNPTLAVPSAPSVSVDTSLMHILAGLVASEVALYIIPLTLCLALCIPIVGTLAICGALGAIILTRKIKKRPTSPLIKKPKVEIDLEPLERGFSSPEMLLNNPYGDDDVYSANSIIKKFMQAISPNEEQSSLPGTVDEAEPEIDNEGASPSQQNLISHQGQISKQIYPGRQTGSQWNRLTSEKLLQLARNEQ
jgi:hypothetical protein